MNIPDHTSESLETIFGLNTGTVLKFFDADADPGTGNLFDPRSGIRDGKIRIQDKHPGSSTPFLKINGRLRNSDSL